MEPSKPIATEPKDEAAKIKRRLERLEQESARKDKRIGELDERIAELLEEIKRLEKELAQLLLNSTNSSKPPSSDGIAGPQRPRCRKKANNSKRKPGGQPGHPGRHRQLVAAGEVSAIVEVRPEQCKDCGHSFAAEDKQIGEVFRHQVVDLPPITPQVTEYQCQKLNCTECGSSTRAGLPEEAKDQIGPRITALIAYLTVVCRVPRRAVNQLVEELTGISISLGSAQKCWEQVSAAVAEPCQELQQRLASEPVLNVDETGWRLSGVKRWLWAFVASGYTYYTVAPGRGAEVLVGLLGVMFAGILCSDRLAVYQSYHKGRAQYCWAHLKRNLQGVLDQAKHWQQEQFARDALALHASLFRLWWKFQEGKIDRGQLLERAQRIRRGFRSLAERWWDNDHRNVANLANALGKHADQLFRFLEQPGVEPTNNSAERALRPAVQWRKICFGNRSQAGATATARLLTVSQTCRRQNLGTLSYLTTAVTAHRRGAATPSLIPLK